MNQTTGDDDRASATGKAATNVAKALSAGAGASAGLLVGGPAGALLGAFGAQAAVDSVSEVFEALNERRRLRAAVPLTYAAHALASPLADIRDRLGTDEHLQPLAGAAITAAANTRLDEKLLALGECLELALRDDTVVDREWLIADALDVIEAPHLKVLLYLNETYMDDLARPRLTTISSHMSEAGTATRLLLAALASKALIIETPEYRDVWSDGRVGARYYQITEFGHEVLARIQRAAGHADWEAKDAEARGRREVEAKRQREELQQQSRGLRPGFIQVAWLLAGALEDWARRASTKHFGDAVDTTDRTR